MMLVSRVLATLLITICQFRSATSAVLSLNKSIRLSNQFLNWQAQRAVDGNRANKADTCNCCAATIPQLNPWYELDLGKSYTIHRITVEGRAEKTYDQHFQSMHIYFKRINNGFTNEETSESSATYLVNYTLPQPKSTRFVSLVLLDRTIEFTICELTVYGDCADEEFGEFCENNCFCEGTPCDNLSGVCPTGICQPGYKGQTCSTTCQLGTYGSGCTEDCGKCVGYCDITNGNCPGQCLPGYQGEKCNQECDSGKYGQDCLNDCGRCRNGEPCNIINGICTECADGYQMNLCNTECNPGHYGKNCANTCGQCKIDTVCVFTNGTCPSGCQAGYEGYTCKKECSDGFYGENCLYGCGKCLNGEACNRVTGICDSGCSPGFKNNKCDETCQHGSYGNGCLNVCGNCKSGATCNNINGACENGCQAGYKVPLCIEECDNGRYGEGCLEECGFCLNGEPCDKSNGTCSGCAEGYRGIYCRSSLTKSPSSGVPAGAVVGAVAGVLIIVSVAVGVFWFLRLRRADGPLCSCVGTKDHSDTKDQNEAISSQHLNSLYSTPTKTKPLTTVAANDKKKKDMPKPSATGSKELEKKIKHAERSEYYQFLIKRTDLKICQLWDYIYQKKKEEDLLFHQEFNRLPSGLLHKSDIACLQKNKSKNRYRALWTYDHSRVPLEAGKGESDYINASFIDGEVKTQKFIASQGPTEEMKGDFLRMLWQQNVKQIVMLTDLMERGAMKCLMYWPKDVEGEITFGKVTVKLVSENKVTDYVIRNLKIRQGEDSWRNVTQYHFLSWPDKDVPDSTWPLVKFWRLVMHDTRVDAGPILVHCSAGIGRTGTFIALDNAYDKAKASGVIKILDTVTQLREQRVNMVQTKDQYVFLHEIVAESLLFGTHLIWLKEFPEIYDYMMQNDTDSGAPRLLKQQKLIEESVEDRQRVMNSNRTAADAVYSNVYIHGNNPETVISIDEYIPKSRSMADVTELGALLLQNYEEKEVFIVSKSPTKATLEGFWSLVAEQNITTIVTVPETSGTNRKRENMCRDLGASDETVQTSFGVRVTEDITNDLYSQKRFTYDSEDGIKEIVQFEFNRWDHKQPVPDNARSMIDFLDVVLDQQPRLTATQPVLIHCRNGFERSGLVCVLLNELDRMRRDQGRINIIQSVKLMKARNGQIIPNFEQYKYLYDAIMETFRKGDVYANC